MSTMTKKQKSELIKKLSGGQTQPKKNRRGPRKRVVNRGVQVVIPASPPMRNGQGRQKGQKRQRGGSDQVTTFGNMRNFTIPIDEDIGQMVGSTSYAVVGAPGQPVGFSINPGNATMFPFISRIAQNYERYEFTRLRFEYRPSASVFANVGSQGLVGIAATMDAIQVPPSTQAQADVLYHGPIVETARPTSLSLPKSFLQSKSNREKFFVRQTGLIPGGADPHSYDCGQVFFWVNGQTSNATIGTMRVVGQCILSNPASDLSVGFAPNFKVALFSGANQAVPASGTSFFPAQPVTITNPVGIVQDAAFGTYTLPAGNWLVDWSGDIDNTGTASTINLTITASLQINGANISPFLSNTCTGPNASNTLACHAAITIPWFVQSNGTTTVRVNCTATYAAAGVVDIDSIIRFTAV